MLTETLKLNPTRVSFAMIRLRVQQRLGRLPKADAPLEQIIESFEPYRRIPKDLKSQIRCAAWVNLNWELFTLEEWRGEAHVAWIADLVQDPRWNEALLKNAHIWTLLGAIIAQAQHDKAGAIELEQPREGPLKVIYADVSGIKNEAMEVPMNLYEPLCSVARLAEKLGRKGFEGTRYKLNVGEGPEFRYEWEGAELRRVNLLTVEESSAVDAPHDRDTDQAAPDPTS